jgi:hypothetical protein
VRSYDRTSFSWEVRFVLFGLVYLLLRRVVRLIAFSFNEVMNTEVEVVILRHQLMVLKRQVGRPSLRRRDRLFMAALSRALPRARWSSFVVSPQTLLRWHRALVKRKWTFRRAPVGGRAPISDEVRELIVRMGRDNPRWGCVRIRGELAKLGIRVSATKIRTLLRANGLMGARTPIRPLASDSVTSTGVLVDALHGGAPMVPVLGGRSNERALEIENAVLRNQLAVFRRGVKRPLLGRFDRVLLSAAGTLRPRELDEGSTPVSEDRVFAGLAHACPTTRERCRPDAVEA